jgi:pilus assembly protein CpaE
MTAKILVVDDDLDTVRMAGMMLERQGYQIAAASSGMQALKMAKSEKPDLILLDLMMPDMDGIEVTRRLREDPETRDILIIMFTAKAQTDDKLVGFDAGADDYIPKPAQPRELVAHVRAVLNRAQRSFAPGVSSSSARLLEERGNVIGVISAKGGIGVSTVAVNLGIALTSKHRKSVIVADYRPGAGTIGLEIGLPATPGMTQFLEMQPSEITAQGIEAALLSHPSNVRFFLSSPEPQDAHYIAHVDQFMAITNHLAYLSPVTVLDLGPGATPVNERVLPECNEIVVILEPVSQTVVQTRYLIEYLHKINIGGDQITTVLVNRVRAGIQLPLGQVQDQLGQTVNAIFTAAPELFYQSQMENVPVLLKQADGITAQQFLKLADGIAPSL